MKKKLKSSININLGCHQLHTESTTIKHIASAEIIDVIDLVDLMKSKRKSPQNRVNHPHKGGVEWKRILEGHWLNNGNIMNLNSSQQDNSPQICFTTLARQKCTLNMKESRMWSLPSRSFRVARSVASSESGSTLDIFTFHSYKESFTNST